MATETPCSAPSFCKRWLKESRTKHFASVYTYLHHQSGVRKVQAAQPVHHGVAAAPQVLHHDQLAGRIAAGVQTARKWQCTARIGGVGIAGGAGKVQQIGHQVTERGDLVGERLVAAEQLAPRASQNRPFDDQRETEGCNMHTHFK